MSYKIEYLITIESKGGFCDSVATFNNLLKSFSEININDGNIKFKNIEFLYEINSKEIPNQNQRYFHASLTLKELKHEKTFLELLKIFRDIIYKANAKISILLDELSIYYSSKAYPLIHITENSLRKLISKFMLINLGMEWSLQTVPSEVQKSIKTKRSKSGITDILHDVDFIQLSDFLFKKYQTKSSDSLFNLIKSIKTDENFDNNQLLEYLPRSNWERYFVDLVDCDDLYLSKRWNRLYELRCLVAHNTVISNSEFEEIEKLCKEINDKITDAINGLDKVYIPESDIELLHENVATNLNELYGKFINEWKNLQFIIMKLVVNQNLTDEELDLRLTNTNILQLAEKHNIIDNNSLKKIFELRELRNLIVHENSIEIDPKYVEHKTHELIELLNDLKTK